MGTLGMVLPGDRLPEAVTFALVVGIARNHRQMKTTSSYFHLMKVSCDSDNWIKSYGLRKSAKIFEKNTGAPRTFSAARTKKSKNPKIKKKSLLDLSMIKNDGEPIII